MVARVPRSSKGGQNEWGISAMLSGRMRGTGEGLRLWAGCYFADGREGPDQIAPPGIQLQLRLGCVPLTLLVYGVSPSSY